jgi:predicted phosphodiesterase
MSEKRGKTLDEFAQGHAGQILSLRDQLEVLANERALQRISLPKKAPPFKFGVLSCTHFGSIYEEIAMTKAIYEWFGQEGIKTVYHCGDMTEGAQMRKGHEHEVHKHGADAQIDWAVEHYPYIKGITTHLISGNHDAAHMNNGGTDVCARIGERREDINYLGSDAARWIVERKGGKDIRIDMLHPGGGSSYALSYKPQKIIEQIESGQKPDVLLIGHFHKAMTLPAYRGVAAVMAGCTQRQSQFMMRNGLAAHTGAHIIECRVLEDQVLFSSCWRGFNPPKADIPILKDE